MAYEVTNVLLYVFCIQNTRLKNIALFWNVSMCSLVEWCPGFVGICWPQTKAHEEASSFLWNDGNTALTSGSLLRRQHSESSCPEEFRSEVTRRFPTVSLVHSTYIYKFAANRFFNRSLECCFCKSLDSPLLKKPTWVSLGHEGNTAVTNPDPEAKASKTVRGCTTPTCLRCL